MSTFINAEWKNCDPDGNSFPNWLNIMMFVDSYTVSEVVKSDEKGRLKSMKMNVHLCSARFNLHFHFN